MPHTAPGFPDFSRQAEIDRKYLEIPNPAVEREELKWLTKLPHPAGSKRDYATALYVAAKFRADGLETRIVEYTGWFNLPREVSIEALGSGGTVLMRGPSREHVKGDPYDNNPEILPAFNSGSPSADITAPVVYANYGRREDFEQLEAMGVDLKGKLILMRYGANFRGAKVYLAQKHGAAGVILYSDPAEDGYFRGGQYPYGPWRPATGVQRGSVQYLFLYPGDATTPGIASTPDLPASKRIPPDQITSLPSIPSIPLSYQDAEPILEHLEGPVVPYGWQGALPFTYHIGGTDAVRVHLELKMEYKQRPVWDVVGKITGAEYPRAWVIAGSHRDAWVYGAADPGSGTVALLEAARGVGALLKHGWKPKRTMIFSSWDGEEEGLIGSTEWTEAHARELAHAVAYFNTDVAVTGPNFEASAVPSLKKFLLEITREVPSPEGGSVYQAWKRSQQRSRRRQHSGNAFDEAQPVSPPGRGVRIGDLGSGSDFTPFLQHMGVPSTDISSTGPYGVYHSTFDDYKWFVMNADPHFLYEQEMSRIFGLEALHMADADVLPYDYVTYGKQITAYLTAAEEHAAKMGLDKLNFQEAFQAARRMTRAASAVSLTKEPPRGNLAELNRLLRQVEEDLLIPAGLPNRPWYKHSIYAPGIYTGYAAVPLPGIHGAITQKNELLAQSQIQVLTAALTRATRTLKLAAGESRRPPK